MSIEKLFYMNLKEYTASLTEQQQFNIAIELLEKSLPLWTEFSSKKKNLEYVDTLVAMHHTVDRDIIVQTVKLVREWLNGTYDEKEQARLSKCYADPIVALQDGDWEIPDHIQLIVYSSYNLLGKINGETSTVFGDEQLYCVINQAIDSILRSNIMTDDEIKELIKSQ